MSNCSGSGSSKGGGGASKGGGGGTNISSQSIDNIISTAKNNMRNSIENTNHTLEDIIKLDKNIISTQEYRQSLAFFELKGADTSWMTRPSSNDRTLKSTWAMMRVAQELNFNPKATQQQIQKKFTKYYNSKEF